LEKTDEVAEAKSSCYKKNLLIGTLCVGSSTLGLGMCVMSGGTAPPILLTLGGKAALYGTTGFLLSKFSMQMALTEAETLRNINKKRLQALSINKKQIDKEKANNEKEIKKVNERSLMYAVKIDPGVVQEAWNSCAKRQHTFSEVKGEVYFEVNEKKVNGKFNIDAHCFGRGNNNSINGTMLHMASFYGKYNMVLTLLSAKANVLVDDEGKTPCMLAAEKNNKTVLEIFKNHCLNDFNRELLFAAEKGFGEMITSLLNAGADEKYRDEEKKWNALLWAVYQEEKEAVKACLDSGKFDVNEVCENSKQSALHIAARYNKGTIIVEMLLDDGADVENEDKDGYTAFLLAVKFNPWSGGVPQKIRDKMMERNIVA